MRSVKMSKVYIPDEFTLLIFNSSEFVDSYLTSLMTATKNSLNYNLISCSNIELNIEGIKNVANYEGENSKNFQFLSYHADFFGNSDVLVLNFLTKKDSHSKDSEAHEQNMFNSDVFFQLLSDFYSYYSKRVSSIISLVSGDNTIAERAVKTLEGTDEMEIIYVDSIEQEDIQDIVKKLSKQYEESVSIKDFRNCLDTLDSIYNFTGSNYHRHLANCHKFIIDHPDDKAKISNSIEDYTEKMGTFKDETHLFLSKFFQNIMPSLYLEYHHLSKYQLDVNKPDSLNLIIRKYDVMKDENLFSLALGKRKPFKKEKDSLVIARERTSFLIKSIKVLVAQEKGYLLWREFLCCQHNARWLLPTYHHLKDLTTTIIKRSTICSVTKSKINNIQMTGLVESNLSSHNIIYLLRLRKSGSQNDFSEGFAGEQGIQELEKAVTFVVEKEHDQWFMLVSWYYLSVCSTTEGLHQNANNHAIKLMELYPIVDASYKKLCLYLALLAWGYSQYSIGRRIEGIACMLASFDYREGELLPFIEEGGAMIVRFIKDEQLDFPTDVELWREFHSEITPFQSVLDSNFNSFPQENGDDRETLKDIILLPMVTNFTDETIMLQLISSYIKEKKYDTAKDIIVKCYERLLPNLLLHKHTICELLYEWSLIVYSTKTNEQEICVAKQLIDLCVSTLSQREKMYHFDDKMSIRMNGRPFYQLKLDIDFEIFSSENQSMVDNQSNALYHDVEKSIVKLSLITLAEQLEFNQSVHQLKKNNQIEIEKRHQRYIVEKNEYEKEKLSKILDIDYVMQKNREFYEELEFLKANHPHFMALPEISMLPFVEIQSALEENELFFQPIVTSNNILSLLISRKEIKFLTVPCDFPNLKKEIRFFCEYAQTNSVSSENKQENSNSQSIENCVLEISNIAFHHLLNYLSTHSVTRIFYCPEMELELFPLILAKNDKLSLISQVKSIVNLTNTRALLKFERHKKFSRVLHRILGKNNDSELQKIEDWINKTDNHNHISYSRIDRGTAPPFSKDTEMLAIYAHGVSDSYGGGTSGSLGLEGCEGFLSMETVLDLFDKPKCFILVSCSGGSPNYKAIQDTRGTWTTMFQRLTGIIIACKWDVQTTETISIMSDFFHFYFESDLSIDEALYKAQCEFNKTDYSLWSGIEFWIN